MSALSHLSNENEINSLLRSPLLSVFARSPEVIAGGEKDFLPHEFLAQMESVFETTLESQIIGPLRELSLLEIHHWCQHTMVVFRAAIEKLEPLFLQYEKELDRWLERQLPLLMNVVHTKTTKNLSSDVSKRVKTALLDFFSLLSGPGLYLEAEGAQTHAFSYYIGLIAALSDQHISERIALEFSMRLQDLVIASSIENGTFAATRAFRRLAAEQEMISCVYRSHSFGSLLVVLKEGASTTDMRWIYSLEKEFTPLALGPFSIEPTIGHLDGVPVGMHLFYQV